MYLDAGPVIRVPHLLLLPLLPFSRLHEKWGPIITGQESKYANNNEFIKFIKIKGSLIYLLIGNYITAPLRTKGV